MIMPNLGAFIARGRITALTISNGWIDLIARAVGAIPNTATSSTAFSTRVSVIAGPIIVFLLPILIATPAAARSAASAVPSSARS